MPIVAKSARPVEPVVTAPRPDIKPRPRQRAPLPAATEANVAAASPAAPELAFEPEPKPDDYVGYKHPPKDGQFKKGKSGNPNGRPKGAKGMKTIVRKVLTEKVSVRTAAGVKRMTKMEALIHKKTELAFAGNIRAILACGTMYQDSVPDEASPAAAAAGGSPALELTDTGRAILDLFAEEIREEERNKERQT